MSNNKKKIESHTEKNLPDVFKELKESQAKMRQVQKREEEIKRIKKERKNNKHTFKENVGYYIEKIKRSPADRHAVAGCPVLRLVEDQNAVLHCHFYPPTA